MSGPEEETLFRIRRGDQRPQLGHDLRVDRVLDRRLAVPDVGAGCLERVARRAAELDRDHRVVRAVRDRDRRERRLEVASQPATVGMKPLSAISARGARRP